MKRIKVADLPDFDTAPTLAYLTDILEANDPALLTSALGDIAHALEWNLRGHSDFLDA